MIRKSLLLLSLLTLFACPDNPSEENATPVQFSFVDPGDSEATAPSDEPQTLPIEARDAAMLIFRGTVNRDESAPFEMEFVRSIEGEMHRDIDTALGPEQFITIAKLVDGNGDLLWQDRVNSLYQVILNLEVVLGEASPIPLDAEQVYRFISGQYPQLLEFGLIVPTSFEDATELVVTIAIEDGSEVEAGRFDLAEMLSEAEPPSLAPEVKTIFESGPREDRVDFAIIADGYTEGEKGKFFLDAESIATKMLETEPFKSGQEAYNVHAVFVASNESGAGYDCTGNIAFDRGCKNDLRDTPFSTVFVISALSDTLNLDLQDTSDRVAMPLEIARIFETSVAAGADEIVLLSNTSRRSGFAGLYMSIVTAYDSRTDFPHTAVHELGHSFGILGDEYNIDGDPCLFNEPLVTLPANIAADVDGLKWQHWVEEGTALPTPPSAALSVDVGAFEGAYNCDPLYRPAFNCKMNNSTSKFCPVCSEQLVRRFFGTIDPTPGVTFTTTEEGLQIDVDETSLERAYQWSLDGEVVSEEGSFVLESSVVPTTWTELTLSTTVASELVRDLSDRLTETRTVWIKK